MNSFFTTPRFTLAACALALLIGCGPAPTKKFYMLNYVPEPLTNRLNPNPYPYTIRIKEFAIEKAYDQQSIVYRTSAFELGRYFYRAWAVSPSDMFVDLIQKHFDAVNLVSHAVRRLDEGVKPDYELNGIIEAIEQYESEENWFAHLAFRLSLVRLSDNRVVYSRDFDSHKQVPNHDPIDVVRELSRIMDLLISQAIHDVDVVLMREYGLTPAVAKTDSAAATAPATAPHRGAGGE
jgi:ABC-type uncharacterized transport system auxiliary subunit